MPLLPKKLIVVIVIQLGLLALLPLYKVLTAVGGADVLLEVTPVVSQITEENNYVVLVYDGLTRLDSSVLGQQVFIADEPIFVILRQDGVGWVPSSVLRHEPEPTETYIRGAVVAGNAVISTDGTLARLNTNHVLVRYGVEAYYLPEGAVLPSSASVVRAQVALQANGQGVLKQLYIDDQPWP